MAQKTQQELDKKLLKAAFKGDMGTVKKLLKAGANINARDTGVSLHRGFLEAFKSSVDGSKAGTKTAAKMLADGLLRDIPFDAKSIADARAKRELVGVLESLISKKKEDFLVDCVPALSEALDEMKGSTHSIFDALIMFKHALAVNPREYVRAGGDIKKLLK